MDEAQLVQVEYGVCNDASIALLVASTCHHDDGDTPGPHCLEHHLVSLYHTL